MKLKTYDCEVWVMMNADGDYEIGKDDEQAADQFENQIGGNGPRRLVKVMLSIPAPTLIEVRGTVPAEGGEVLLTI